MCSRVCVLCVERGSKFLARRKGSSRGEKVPRKERPVPCDEIVPHKERFVSIGKVHNQTAQAALNYCHRVFVELVLGRQSMSLWV